MLQAYIYKITNPKGKIYIGSTINILRRKYFYKNIKRGRQQKLGNSILKYGFDNHTFEVIECCSIEKRFEREVFFGLKYNCLSRMGLNLRLPKITDKQVCISKELRKKISDHAKLRVGELNPAFGNKRPDFAAMASKRGKTLVGSNNPMFGTKRPQSVKDAVSIARKLKDSSGESPRNKVVIDFNTGVFYNSVMEIVLLYGYNKSTLTSMLNGYRKNKTNFCYA